MAQEEVIARRYARGLAECAAEAGRLDEVRRDLRTLADVLDPAAGSVHVPELRHFLESPVVTPAEKLAASKRIMESLGIGETAANFVKVLLGRNRIGFLPRIAREFADVSAEMTGEYTALVHTARPLSEDQADRLVQALSTAFGGKVRLHQRVEPGLLAGVRVSVGDKTFDGSVLGRLHGLRERLRHSGSRDLEMLEETPG